VYLEEEAPFKDMANDAATTFMQLAPTRHMALHRHRQTLSLKIPSSRSQRVTVTVRTTSDGP